MSKKNKRHSILFENVRYCWISLDILALCDPFFEPQRSQTSVIDCQLTSHKTRLLKLGIRWKPLETVGG